MNGDVIPGSASWIQAVVAMAVVLGSKGVGSLLLRGERRGHPGSRRLEPIAEYLLGIAVVGYAVFLLGLAGQLNRVSLTSLLVLSLAASAFELKTLATDISLATSWVARVWRQSALAKLALTLIALVCALNLLDPFAPPTAADSLSYHLRIPYDYLRAGRLVYHPFIMYNASHLAEMYSTLPLALAGDIAVQLCYYSFSLIFLAVVISVGALLFSDTVGVLAGLFIITTPMLTSIKSSGHVEPLMVAGLVLGVGFLVQAFESEARRWPALLAGAMLGVACATKYYGLFGLPLFGLLALVLWRQKRVSHMQLGTVFLFGAIGLAAVGSGFYVKNLVVVGNPLYPAFFDLFGGRDWSADLDRISSEIIESGKRGGGTGVTGFIRTFWDVNFNGERYHSGRDGFGPIFIVLTPLIYWTWRASAGQYRSRIVLLTIGLVAWWGLWFALALHRGRHLLTAYVLWAMLIAAGIDLLMKRRGVPIRKAAVAAGLIVGLTFQLAINALFNMQFGPVAVGLEDRDVFLRRKLWNYRDAEWINSHLPANAKVVATFGYIGYYVKRDYFYPSPVFQGAIDFTKIANIDQLEDEVERAGYTHLIMSSIERPPTAQLSSAGDAYMQRYVDLWEQLGSTRGELVYERSDYAAVTRTLPGNGARVRTVIYELR